MGSQLQSEIKQTRPFARIEHEAVLGLLRTAALVEHAIEESLRPFGVTATQFNVLRILRGAGDQGLCGREIGERMITRVPDVTRLLDRLEKSELITRDRDREDRRHVTARITPKGRDLLEKAANAGSSIEQRFQRLSQDELQALIAALDELRRE
jgi:DNA-binding MarR family transcriptional regulator